MTLWFHPLCAATSGRSRCFRLSWNASERARPGELERAARASLAHRRSRGSTASSARRARRRNAQLPRAHRARELAHPARVLRRGAPRSGGSCTWTGRKAYFETDDVLDRVLYFSRDLSADEREELRRACGAGPAGRRCRGAKGRPRLSSSIPRPSQ